MSNMLHHDNLITSSVIKTNFAIHYIAILDVSTIELCRQLLYLGSFLCDSIHILKNDSNKQIEFLKDISGK